VGAAALARRLLQLLAEAAARDLWPQEDLLPRGKVEKVKSLGEEREGDGVDLVRRLLGVEAG
jgi:hypothetical protein